MLECRACVFRCIRTIATDLAPTSVQYPTRHAQRQPWRPAQTRTIATAVAHSTGDADDIANDRDGQISGNGTGQSSGKKFTMTANETRALKAELTYLKDPVKLAQHVHYTLRREQLDKALNLCRLASKTMDCVVSWNHVVDKLMTQGRMTEAIKIYNEMKKRAQFPDSYTYMLLLRGFPVTRTHHGAEVKADMVRRAVAIYESMLVPSSKVKPSIKHTNAVLRVCALANDMDALWTVVSKIPEDGPACADYITYTVLLSAIRHNAEKLGEGMSPVERIQQQQEAIDEARRIWVEIIAKWRKGQLLIDDELVAEMGNMLLISNKIEDWDNVLDLIQQTANVPRAVAPVGSPERQTGHVPSEEPLADDTIPTSSPQKDADDWTATNPSDSSVFASIDTLPLTPSETQRTPRSTSLTYIRPSNATLSVLIAACARMRIPRAVFTYWDSYVLNHAVQPDIANLHALLRLLSMNRTSAKVALLLRAIIDPPNKSNTAVLQPTYTTFRLAMSACARDWKNPHVLTHAAEVVDLMGRTCVTADTEVLSAYLRLVLRHATDAVDRVGRPEKEAGKMIAAALDRLDAMVHGLRSEAVAGLAGTGSRGRVEGGGTAGVVRIMIGMIDVLVGKGMVAEEEVALWRRRRHSLDAFVGRLVNSEPREGSKGVRETRAQLARFRRVGEKVGEVGRGSVAWRKMGRGEGGLRGERRGERPRSSGMARRVEG